VVEVHVSQEVCVPLAKGPCGVVNLSDYGGIV